jgi:TM2 domain-containing membrane protein YozV
MNAGITARQRANPDLAAILTWLLPGAGHLYIGRPLFGLLAFAVVEALYFLGLQLSDGRLFEYLDPELQSPFAGALAPEAGNLGALIWHMRTYGFGPGFPRPWPEHIHLGTWLTATSGFLNACLMVRVHFEARAGKSAPLPGLSPDVQVFAAWLVPGLGHVLQRRTARGIAVFAILIGMLVLGTILAEGSNLDRERHFYYWAGQFLVGLPAALLEVIHGHAPASGDMPYVDAGLVMVCLAGLLNVLALLDVHGHAEARLLGPRNSEGTSDARGEGTDSGLAT